MRIEKKNSNNKNTGVRVFSVSLHLL